MQDVRKMQKQIAVVETDIDNLESRIDNGTSGLYLYRYLHPYFARLYDTILINDPLMNISWNH